MAEFTEDSSGEHELISTSLELEQLDAKLFRSKSLWTPARARGVFGGQVISQALLAATRCVEDGFSVHSLHCHFLLSADGSIPILYYVEHIRDGRTYCTRVVKAAQNGRWVFMITCSFQRPEYGQPSHQWPMPRHVPVPKDCPFQEDLFQKQSERPGISEDAKQMLLQYVQERKRSPIAIKPAASVTTTDGLVQNMFWMRAKNVPKFKESFQKCILAYMSDLNFIGTAARSLQLRSGGEPPNRLGMLSSLDHTIWYYDHDFNCADWLLYVMVSPRTGLGRGVVHGRIYTQEGNLIAVLTQEGVVRADLGDNPKKKENPDSTMEEDEIIDVVATDPTPNAAPLTIDTSNFYAAPSPAQTPTTLLSGRPRRESAGIRRASLSYDPDAWEPNRSRAANRAAKAKIKNMQATGSTPKVKLKLTEKSLTANGGGMSFLGSYDRELDSDEEEDLVFEEQFILRMPPGEDCDRLRTMVQARDVKDDVWFKFKDSRRAVFHIGNNTYSAKLVDLPAIIESQKTLDNRQMYKVADICQMLVVEDKLAGDEPPKTTFNIDDYIWPHGLTPPMQHARKRRFRKRVNRNTIETVEKEVERLLDADSQASKIKYEILEDVDPNLSDSEFDPPPEQGGSEAATPGGTGMDTFDGDDGYQDGDGPGTAAQQEDDLFEQELQAELAKGLGEESDDEDGDDDEDQEESESEEEGDEEEDEEFVRTRKLLNEEIRDLEAAVAKKEQDIAGTQNILIKRRFEDALKKLKTDLDAKVAQRAGLLSAKDKAEAAAAEEEEEEEEEEEDEDDPDALDGDEQPVVLDVEGVATVLQPLGGVDSREMSTPRGDGDIEVATPMPSQPGTPAPDGMEIG